MANKKRQMKRKESGAASVAANFAAGRSVLIRSVDAYPVDGFDRAFIVEAPQRKVGQLVTEE